MVLRVAQQMVSDVVRLSMFMSEKAPTDTYTPQIVLPGGKQSI